MTATDDTAEAGGKRPWLAHVLMGLLVLASVAWVAFGLRTVGLGDSANSRLATVYSLIHHGTWYIDRPLDEDPIPFERVDGRGLGTIDKVELNGRLLSTKPPILPLAMTAEYWILHKVAGLDLRDREDWRPIVQSMIALFSVVPYFIGTVFFVLLLNLLVENPWRRLFPLAALTFGTQLPGFATELNNHTPAIAALIVALYFSIGLCSGKLAPRPHRFLGYGVAAALVFTLDMPLTIFAAVAGLGLLWKFPRHAALWGGIGVAPLLILHFGVMLYVTGSPLPIQMHKDLYLYEASAWRIPGQIDALNEPKGAYFFHMTFGRYGIFLLYPILLTGVAGCIYALRREWAIWRWYYAAGIAAIILLFAYYLKGTNNYGGAAYGFRWGMGAMPILILMALPLYKRMTGPAAWTIALVLLAISAYSGWECYQAPWGDSHEWTCRWIFGPPYLKP